MPKKLLILLCVSVPSFMINLDSNIVAVSLTSIAHSMHADFAATEWVISAYTLAFATLLMPAGALADRFGRKRMLVLGLTLFTIASGICGAAHSAGVLNAARALQGMGAALQLSSALAILSHAFRGAERAKAFAFWGSVIGVAIMLGPVAGGFITQVLGWQWAFYINLPVGVVMIAMTLYAVQESKDPHAIRIDLAGFLTFTSCLALLTLALISGNRTGWDSKVIHAELFGSAAFFAIFLAVERVQKRPMIDFAYFRRPTFVGAQIAGVSFAAAFLVMLTYLPIYFEIGLGDSPMSAGLSMLPLAVPLFLVPRIVVWYFDKRLTGRAFLAVGLALVGIGLLWTGFRIAAFSYAAILPSMLVASLGAGILNGQIAKVGMTVIPPERAGMASGLSGTIRFTGIVVGFAGLGAVLLQRIGNRVGHGLPDASFAVRQLITHAIANGNFVAPPPLLQRYPQLPVLVRESLGAGYEGVLLSAGLIAVVASVLCWLLISDRETAPHGATEVSDAALGMPVD
ncbi:MAG: MFS transporter [Janthinobacterium lividum]